MRYIPVLVGAAAALLVGAIVVVALLAILASIGLDTSLAFGITLLTAIALGVGVGVATQRKLKKMRK
jgi:hypothetical protein